MDKQKIETLLDQLTIDQLLELLEAWQQLIAHSQSKNFFSRCRTCYVLAA